jgi:hypothetical protein
LKYERSLIDFFAEFNLDEYIKNNIPTWDKVEVDDMPACFKWDEKNKISIDPYAQKMASNWKDSKCNILMCQQRTCDYYINLSYPVPTNVRLKNNVCISSYIGLCVGNMYRRWCLMVPFNEDYVDEANFVKYLLDGKVEFGNIILSKNEQHICHYNKIKKIIYWYDSTKNAVCVKTNN